MSTTKKEIVFYGKGFVGKTSLINSLKGIKFVPYGYTTPGTTHIQFTRDNIEFNVLDTCGNTTDTSTDKLMNPDRMAVVVFSTQTVNISNCRNIVDTLRSKNPYYKIVLCCTKMDCPRHFMLPSTDKIKKELNVDCFEVSSKTGQGINEFLEYLKNN
jgi:small GTP-binding protein